MAQGKEAKIEERLRRWAECHGWLCRKFASPAHPGVPDRIFIKNGVVAFIELKRPGEKPTSQQAREILKLIEHGANANWFDSVDGATEWLCSLERTSPRSNV